MDSCGGLGVREVEDLKERGNAREHQDALRQSGHAVILCGGVRVVNANPIR